MNALFAPALRPTLIALACAASCLLALPAAARCIDEDRNAPLPETPGGAVEASSSTQSPRDQVLELIKRARERSKALGAARLLTEAAAYDVEETRASGKPQASLNLTSGYQGSGNDATPDAAASNINGSQTRASVNVSAPLFDFGRLGWLTQWRAAQAEATRLNQISAEEQVALQVVSLSAERSRYRMQSQVYRQYATKMSCLVDALGEITKADKGRASELIQARKTLAQAELAYEQSQTLLRQMETRLRRYVGDPLPPGSSMATLLGALPLIDKVHSDIERSAVMAGMDAQAEAADSYAKSVAAGQKPQLGWNAAGSKAVGLGGNPRNWSLGLSLNVPVFNPGADAQLSSARKRAEAARLQKLDSLDARKAQAAEVLEQGNAAMDRAQRTVNVLRDSESVRNVTLQQWQQLGKRSLFDVMSAEGEHYNLRVSYVNALHDALQSNALLRSIAGTLDLDLR
ncbi:MAG: TolC family protein [Burkholderiales bacterium]|nr:TolC family protein [Burkholderiales bacterium]